MAMSAREAFDENTPLPRSAVDALAYIDRLEDAARQGYEIHGEKVKAKEEKAWSRGYWAGVAVTLGAQILTAIGLTIFG